MTHRFMFKTDAGEVAAYAVVDPELIAREKPFARSQFLWTLDSYLNARAPLLNQIQMTRYHAWTTEVLACAVSKVKRRLYKKVIK